MSKAEQYADIRADIQPHAIVAASAAKELEHALHQLLMHALHSSEVLDGDETDNEMLIGDLKLAQDIVNRVKKKCILVAERTQARA